MKRSDATAALSWANDTRATSDTRITAAQFRILCVIAGGCSTRVTIAAAAGCGESTVPRAVRRLEKIGALKCTPGAPGKANSYAVLVRQETGITADTCVATSRVASKTRIANGRSASETGAAPDTAQTENGASAHIEHAQARADSNLINTISEIYPETPEKVVVLVAANSDRPPPPTWQRVLDAVRSPFLDENKEPKLILEGYIVEGWLRAGADLELDVIPTVRRLIERKSEPVPWDYFTRAVRETAAKRKRHAQTNPITQDEAKGHEHFDRTSTGDPGVRRRPRSLLTQRAMQLMSEN